jgi:hypothetical protein
MIFLMRAKPPNLDALIQSGAMGQLQELLLKHTARTKRRERLEVLKALIEDTEHEIRECDEQISFLLEKDQAARAKAAEGGVTGDSPSYMFAIEPPPPEGFKEAQDTETEAEPSEREAEAEKTDAQDTEAETEHVAEEVADTEAEEIKTEAEPSEREAEEVARVGTQDTETEAGNTEAEAEPSKCEAEAEKPDAQDTETETEDEAGELGDTEREAETEDETEEVADTEAKEDETEAEEPQMVTTDFMDMDTMFGSHSETWIDENLEEVPDPNRPVVEAISEIEGVSDSYEPSGDTAPSPVEPKIESQTLPEVVSLVQRLSAAKNKKLN